MNLKVIFKIFIYYMRAKILLHTYIITMVADFHNDYLSSSSRISILQKYSKSDNKIIGAIFRGGKDYVYAKTTLNCFLENKTDNLFFAFEDFSYEEDLPNLIYGLLDYMPVYVGLTWNGENNLAYGAGSSGKIKPRGIAIIKELNKRGIYLDVAHLSEQSFYDALCYTDKILCSHTCFYDLCPHKRNLKTEQIKEITDRGGLIGLTFYTPFLTENKTSTVEDVFRHVDFFVERFGIKNLAIGSDFYGCDNLPKGFSDYSFSVIFKEYLLKKGYKEWQIDAIIYGNLSAFLAERPCFKG